MFEAVCTGPKFGWRIYTSPDATLALRAMYERSDRTTSPHASRQTDIGVDLAHRLGGMLSAAVVEWIDVVSRLEVGVDADDLVAVCRMRELRLARSRVLRFSGPLCS
jgi:hypothetical protein